MLETSALALLTESWSAVGLQWQANHQSSPGRLTCLSLEAVRACRSALGRPNFLRRVRWLWQNDGVPWSWSGSQGCACGQAGSLVSALEHGAHALGRWSPRADRNA